MYIYVYHTEVNLPQPTQVFGLCIHLLCTQRKKNSVFGVKQSTSASGKVAMTSGTSFQTSIICYIRDELQFPPLVK
jgi:hypothetical protein